MPDDPTRELLRFYDQQLEAHGDTARGAGWPNERDRLTRFDVMLETARALVGGGRFRLVDLGCGTGELLRRARAVGLDDVDYTGVDRSRAAVDAASAKFPSAVFHCLDVGTASQAELRTAVDCDVLVSSGLFTLRRGLSQEEMTAFLRKVVRAVWPHVRVGMVFNVMSKHVDWEREDLFHVGFDEMAALLRPLVGRQIGFRADYGLYEYVTYARKAPFGP